MRAAGVAAGRAEISFTQERVGKSSYACFALSGTQSAPVIIRLA